ncbi:MAG: hypothetical protein WCO06_01040 [Candidatus Roizmanbacteria bacterium]
MKKVFIVIAITYILIATYIEPTATQYISSSAYSMNVKDNLSRVIPYSVFLLTIALIIYSIHIIIKKISKK